MAMIAAGVCASAGFLSVERARSWRGLARLIDPSIMARMLTSEDTANIRNMLQDPDAGGDVLFWLYATVAYAVLRVTTEVLFPGKIGKFTTQRMPRRARTPA